MPEQPSQNLPAAGHGAQHTDGPASPEAALAAVSQVQGWMTEAQARRLHARASELDPGDTITEIGSYHGRSAIVVSLAAHPEVEVVAIDPHAGNDRGPQQIRGSADEGEADHQQFLANLRAAGVAGRIRHVRRPSQEALDEVEGPIQMLYVDGAHRYTPARDDIRDWGRRVPTGGVLLIHDSFSSIGVTLAILRLLAFSGRFRYTGRSGSLAEYRRRDLSGAERVRNAARQMAELPWFARNVAVKVALVLKAPRVARLLRHDSPHWPY
jgi:predicted O-methyltransferase YrrM